MNEDFESQSTETIATHVEGAPVVIDYDHIEQHFSGSGKLGASIEGWNTVEEMFADEQVIAFVNKAVVEASKVKGKKNTALYFSQDLDKEIGSNGVVKIVDLPEGTEIKKERRAGTDFDVNIVDIKPSPSNTLNLLIIRPKGNPRPIKVRSAWAGSSDFPRGRLSNPEWQEYAFVSGVK